MKIKFIKFPTEQGRCVDAPKYQSEYSAGADLCACIDAPITIAPHARALVPSGIAIEMEQNGFGAFIFARSGLASKHGICLANGVGVVDSDYRGQIKVALCNTSDTEYTIQPFERIAQLVIMPVVTAEFIGADTLSDTERGSGGFGSTGK